jgi:uncharacterized repeat protein (TIGR01451 family)
METQKLLNKQKMSMHCFWKPLLLMAFLLSCAYANAQSPTGTVTVVHQICNNDGILAVNITSGMTTPITYTYYSNSGSVVHSNVNSLNDTLFAIPSPIYYLFATDANGVSYSTQAFSMPLPFYPDFPTITNAVCPSLTGSIPITINQGTIPASVKWFNRITNVYVGTGNPMNLPVGSYAAVITDVNGCVVRFADSLEISNVSNITFSVTTTTANCTNGTATVVTPTGGTAPYTYHWSNGANTPMINNLSQGGFTVRATDAQGCYTDNNVEILQAVTINVNTTPTPATCAQNDGSVISFGSGGVSPYTYHYDNGMSGQTATGITGGTNLLVTVTDANGCLGYGYASVTSSTPITVTYTSVNSSCTAPTGSATLTITGGTVPYVTIWNTFPVQSGITLSNMTAGTYGFTVTDAVGCIRTGTAIISPQSVMSGSAYSSSPVCPATTGAAFANVSGTNPPFSYLWNTGATTSTISNATLGNYTCVITDNVGCKITKSTYIQTTSPISLGLNATAASCLFTSDGSILANAVGGTAPYTYSWTNGQTSATATGLATGQYWVYVTDANGCAQHDYTNVGYNAANNSCYCTITGKVYVDLNNNCIFDSGEQGVEHIMIHCQSFGYTFTDANGNYSFAVPTGTYTLSESVQSIYPLASCQNNAVPMSVTASSGCTSTVNFANVINPLHDIHIIKTDINPAIPGNSYTQGLIVQNDGTVSESNIQIGSRHDGQLQYVSSTLSAYTQLNPIGNPDWYSVTSGFPVLAPGASTMIYTDYNVPTNIPLATEVNFWDSAVSVLPMTTWLTDYTPWNNVENHKTDIIGSFDPNFKEVSPKGTGTQGYIATSDSVLDYVVHFQNTGTYYAQKVVVMDTLDSDLDLKSLRLGYSDHSYQASLSESGILKFTFQNINLDWQSNSELGSRCLVSYSIKQKPHLSPGTQIRNSAAIYFDYNAPVITNKTLNTIQFPAGVEELKSTVSLAIYPNPATSELNINISNANGASVINVYDLQGRLLQVQKVTNDDVQKVNINELSNGLYFITVENNKGIKVTAKFMKN